MEQQAGALDFEGGSFQEQESNASCFADDVSEHEWYAKAGSSGKTEGSFSVVPCQEAIADSLSPGDSWRRTQEKIVPEFEMPKAVSAAFQNLPRGDLPKLPWEEGVFECIFGGQGLSSGSSFLEPMRPVQPVVLESIATPQEQKVSQLDQGVQLFSISVKASLDISWEVQREMDMDRALKLWLSLVYRFDWQCNVCIMVFESDIVAEQLTILGDFFCGRAPSTLSKRGKALMKVCDWLQRLHKPFFPNLVESDAYAFLREERDANAPVSRLQGCVEALSFARHVLGLETLEGATSSKRCVGVAHRCDPHELKQAPPFTAQQMQLLHDIRE